MSLRRTMTTAITSRTWINPPIVELVTNPSSHKTINTSAIVYNITFLFQFALVADDRRVFAPANSNPSV